MASGNVARNLAVGFVFLGSLGVLGVASLKMSAVPLFNKVEALAVRFPDVDNLKAGDDIVVHGLRVGQVDDIEYDPLTHPGTPIVVRCRVPQEVYGRLGTGSQFTIHSAGPLGGRYLEITPPPPGGAPPPPPSGFVGSAPGDLFKQLSDLVQSNQKTVKELLENLNSTATEVKETFRTANAGEGTLGLLLKDRQTRDKVEKGLTDLSDTIASLKEDLTGEKGTIGYLLKNAQAKEDLKAAVEDLRKVIGEVREGPGIASRLINDKALADELRAILDDIHDLVHKVNTGQGTLGQVVNNPKAWDELVKILVLARETIEDIREQAPVSTFVNAAFAAF